MKKAKDTVRFDISELNKLPNIGEHNQIVEAMLKAQAEISFKAGIREVVEWLKPKLDKIGECTSEIRGDWTDPRDDCREIWRILSEIKAELKKWGIDEGN